MEPCDSLKRNIEANKHEYDADIKELEDTLGTQQSELRALQARVVDDLLADSGAFRSQLSKNTHLQMGTDGLLGLSGEAKDKTSHL